MMLVVWALLTIFRKNLQNKCSADIILFSYLTYTFV